MYEIDVQVRRSLPFVDAATLAEVARTALTRFDAPPGSTIDVTAVDDPTIHRLNRERLDHDWPTDVISFLYNDDPIVGELIVSVDTAARVAAEQGWPPEGELALYVAHGMLHLLGFDDATDADRAAMRAEEDRTLAPFGWRPPRERHADAIEEAKTDDSRGNA